MTLTTTPEVFARIDLLSADGSLSLSAHLDVSMPGIDRAVARQLIETAHAICPYSKAVYGNIAVTTALL